MRLLAPACVLLLLTTGALSFQDRPPRPPMTPRGVSSATHVISPVAVVTWLTRDGNYSEIDLVVVWRGAPGWFSSSTQGGSSGGGRTGMFQTRITYGSISLEMSLTANPRVATIQEKPVPLDQKNVVLVDHVDSPSGPEVVKTLWIDPTLADAQRIGPVLGRSPEIVAFLRCDLRLQTNLDVVLQKLCAEVIGK